MDRLEAWFAAQGWQPWPFQREAWAAYAAGRDGLVHVPTGAGKTFAAFGGPLLALAEGRMPPGPGLKIVYVTPLKALARDIELALAAALAGVGLAAAVESRTGDTTSGARARQRRRLPEVLVTTPESLALLCARDDAPAALAGVGAVLVDEWHELLGGKRGVLLQLTLSRLRALSPDVRTWGMSATLRDPDEAARALLPPGEEPVVVWGRMARPVRLATLVPDAVDAFPWAGHLGLAMAPKVCDALDPTVSNLIFTNTRSQAERWFQALTLLRPEWAEVTALHHGSLAKEAREAVESGLKSGRVKIVVATSSLDLGVDFPEVERVFQVGSPKGVGRLLQRAGRSAHRPLAACSVTCVPTHGLELLEFAAARRALAKNELEARPAAGGTLDVLAQHLVTCALGGGFTAAEALAQVRRTAAYEHLTEATLAWCLGFLGTGGTILDAYPAYRRLVCEDGRYRVTDKRQAQLHRMNIGTIVADEQAELKLQRGRRLGSIDEGFLARLKSGDRFVFGGRTLELVQLRDLTAICRIAAGRSANVPAWQGTLLPLSTPLGAELRTLLGEQARGAPAIEPETAAAQPILAAQARLSKLPRAGELLLETWATKEGTSLFVHAFAGRAVHESLAALLALRFSRLVKATFSVTANDYGFALTCSAAVDYRALLTADVLTTDGLDADLDRTMDAAQVAKRRFREIARIAGLVRQSYPGQRKAGRAVHVSTSLLYDTLARFDPGHPLVAEARRGAREALSGGDRLEETLALCARATWLWVPLRRPSPLAFPLVVERVRARLGSESLAERIARMQAAWTRADQGEEDDDRRERRGRRGDRPAPPRARGLLAPVPDPDRRGPPLG